MYNNRDDLFGPLGPSARPLADTIYRRIVGEVVTSVNGQRGDVTVDVPDVDESLSDTSPNPVQNRAVAAALAQKGSVQDAVDETVALTPDPDAWIVVRREAAQHVPMAFDADAPAKVVEVPAPVYRYDELDGAWYWSVVDSHIATDYPNDMFAYTDVGTAMRRPTVSGFERSPDADMLAWTATTQADGSGPYAVYVAKRVRGGLNRHGLARLVDIPANLSEMTDDIDLEGRLAQLTTEVGNKQTRQTTLAGYGIQDAWIDGDDIIRLGTKALRPLTVANFSGLMQEYRVPDYAAPRIQSDWEESDPNSFTFIRNKPDLSSLGVQADWEESDPDSLAFIKGKPTLFSGSYDDLTGKPTIPVAQVRANWNETDTGSMAFIQNKPTIPEVRYALVSPQPSDGVVTLQDRAVNDVSLASQVSYQAWRPSTGNDPIGVDSDDPLSALSVSWDPVAGRWTVQDAQGLYDSVSAASYSLAASSTLIFGEWYLEARNPTLTVVSSFDPEDPSSASFSIAADLPGGKHLTLALSNGYPESDGHGGYWVESEIISVQADTPYDSVNWGADTSGFISMHLVPDGNGSYVQDAGENLEVFVSGVFYFVREPYYVFTWSDGGTGHGEIVSDGYGGYRLSSSSDLASWAEQSVYEVTANEWGVTVYRDVYIDLTVTAVDSNGVPTEVSYDGTPYAVTTYSGDCVLHIMMDGVDLNTDEYCFEVGEGESHPGLNDTIEFSGEEYQEYVVTRSPVMVSALPLLALPPQVPGKVRDFVLRLDMPADLELAVRFGDMETRDGDFPGLKAGVNYLSFTETGANRFLVTALQAEAV